MDILLGSNDVGLNWEDARRRTPLAYAARYGHDGITSILLKNNDIEVNSKDERDIKVNLKDESDRTPLLYAAGNGRSAVVNLSLKQDDIEINSRTISIERHCRKLRKKKGMTRW